MNDEPLIMIAFLLLLAAFVGGCVAGSNQEDRVVCIQLGYNGNTGDGCYTTCPTESPMQRASVVWAKIPEVDRTTLCR